MTLFTLCLGLAALCAVYVTVMWRLVSRSGVDVSTWAPHMISVSAVVMIVLFGVSVAA